MKILDLYVQRRIFTAFVLVGLGLVSLFSLFEFVEQLRSVGQGRYAAADALEYVLLTAPSRFMRLTPPSVLLASLLALGAMAGSGELTGLRSLGVSRAMIIRWVLELGLVIMVLLFLIAEFVVPPAQQLAQIQRASKLTPSAEVYRGSSGFWARGANQFLNVKTFVLGESPRDIDILVFRDDGSLERYTHAQRGSLGADGRWTLEGVVQKQYADDRIVTTQAPSTEWQSFLRPQQLQLLSVPPEAMAPTALFSYVQDLRRQQQHPARFEQQLWALVAIPLATAAMILCTAQFVFGSTRGVSVGQRITVGVVIGIVFSLLQQMSVYLGLLFDLNAALSALAPSLLVFSVLAALALKARRQTG